MSYVNPQLDINADHAGKHRTDPNTQTFLPEPVPAADESAEASE